MAALFGVPTLVDLVAHTRGAVEIETFDENLPKHPEIFIIGLRNTDRNCFVEIPITVRNCGAHPINNLAVRAILPTVLVADLPYSAQKIENQTLHVERRDLDESFTQITFLLPTLRIGESCFLPIALQIAPRSWITVPAPHQGRKSGRVALSKIGANDPTQIIGMRVRVTSHAENALSVSRTLEYWFTPSHSRLHLRLTCVAIVSIERIWRKGKKAYRFPLIGSLFLTPPDYWHLQNIVLAQFEKRKTPGSKLTVHKASGSLEIVQCGQDMMVNPGPKRDDFLSWLHDVQGTKPDYYR